MDVCHNVPEAWPSGVALLFHRRQSGKRMSACSSTRTTNKCLTPSNYHIMPGNGFLLFQTGLMAPVARQSGAGLWAGGPGARCE
jgi:hypothetical protein